MIRVAGVNLPENKRIRIALTSVYGIGPAKSEEILKLLKIDESTKPQDLSQTELAGVREEVGKNLVEGELRREVMGNIKRLRDINSYRGSRHTKGLPVRGQRTKTNMRTRKGNKRTTLTSGKRKLEKT
jgi:small subunit ribosomal protein S13